MNPRIMRRCSRRATMLRFEPASPQQAVRLPAARNPAAALTREPAVLLQIPLGPRSTAQILHVIIRMSNVGLGEFASALSLPVDTPKNAEMIHRMFFHCGYCAALDPVRLLTLLSEPFLTKQLIHCRSARCRIATWNMREESAAVPCIAIQELPERIFGCRAILLQIQEVHFCCCCFH